MLTSWTFVCKKLGQFINKGTNSQCVTDPGENQNCKLLDDSTEGALLALGFVGDSSDRSMTHERIGMLDFTETENIQLCKNTMKRMKRQTSRWETVVSKRVSDKKTCIFGCKTDKGIVSLRFLKWLKLNNKKTTQVLKNELNVWT